MTDEREKMKKLVAQALPPISPEEWAEFERYRIRQTQHQYRVRQMQKVLDLFAQTKGRPAETMEEVDAWLASPEGKAATAYDRTPDGKIIPD